MFKTLKGLGKLSTIYTIGDLVTKSAAFLLLPLYTKYLSSSDYGILAIVTMVSSILTFCMSLGTSGVAYRFHYLFNTEEERQQFYGSVWSFLLIFSGCITVILIVLGKPFFESIFLQVSFNTYIKPAIIIAFLNCVFILLPTQLLRLKGEAIYFVSFQFLQFFGIAGFTIWFVVILNWGVEGVIYAQIVNIIPVSIFAIIYLLKNVNINFEWQKIKPIFVYCLPLVPHFLSQWILNVSDRAMLERYVSLHEIGIYSLGYQIGTVVQIVINAGHVSLIPLYSKAHQDNSAIDVIPKMATYFILVASITVVSLISIADWIIIFVTNKDFYGAINVIPWVAYAYFSMAFYFLGVNVLGPLLGRTHVISIVTIVTASVNIILNLIFIPIWGIYAAAASTLLSYIMLAITMNIAAYHIGYLRYEMKRLIVILASTVASTFVKITVEHILNCYSASLCLVTIVITPCTFVFTLTVLGFFTNEEKSSLISISTQCKHIAFNQYKYISNILEHRR